MIPDALRRLSYSAPVSEAIGNLAARCLRGETTLASVRSTAADPAFVAAANADDVDAITA